MGLGDWIMSTAEARHFHDLYQTPCVFALGKTIFYEPEIFANNPKIIKDPQDGQKVVVINNGPGQRPYIAGGDSKRWYWNTDFQIEKGEIYLTPAEIQFGKQSIGKIIIEPRVKETSFSQNKHWPHWAKFVQMAMDTELGPHLRQFSYDRRDCLVKKIDTSNFREALCHLSNAAMVITPDGALHHAAAAMNIPCVTLWGGLVGPDILGYEDQVNIWHETQACGSKSACKHCADAMRSITPEEVLDAALAVYRNIMGQAAPDAHQAGRILAGHPAGL